MTSFKNEETITLRNSRFLVSKRKFTTTYSIDTMSFRGSQVWKELLQDIKKSDSLNLFKSNINNLVQLVIYHSKMYLMLKSEKQINK